MSNNKLTSASGIPYVDHENTKGVGLRGQLLLEDFMGSGR